jgi:hypothetical protein
VNGNEEEIVRIERDRKELNEVYSDVRNFDNYKAKNVSYNYLKVVKINSRNRTEGELSSEMTR